jgi:flagellar M-ring protein FliF
MAKVDLGTAKARAASVLDGFTRGQKTMLGIAVAAVLVSGFLFTKWSSAPSYTSLFSNLSAKDASAVTQELTAKGVPYRLTDGGSTVQVPRRDVYQLRLDLSAEGLPATGAPGYALLDKQGITTSEFRQRVDYQRALEGELANTVGAIRGVSGANVHLVIPKDDLFSKDASKPTASVLVQVAQGGRLAGNQVQAIVHLVASSVEGLDPADVTVADGEGHVLSAPGEDGMAVGDARNEQTTTFESQLSSSIEDLLVPLVGSGRAVVKVKASLDFDKRSMTSETFGKDALAMSESTARETYSGGETSAATGVLGAGVTTTTAPGNSYGKESAERSFARDKVTEQVQTAPGKVSRLSVAVLLDAGAKSVDTRAVQSLVSAAAGLDPSRGDTIRVDALRFDTTAANQAKEVLASEQAAERQSQLFGLLRTLASVALVGVVLLLAFRSARKATVVRVPVALPPAFGASPGYPAESRAMAMGAEPAVALAPPAPASLPPSHVPPPPAPKELMPSGLIDLIDSQPDDVAQMLRGWLADRRG